MSKIVKTTNRDCRRYVTNCVAFDNSNGQLYGRRTSTGLYIVYSYGPHWPLYIYCPETDQWFENEDRASVTTSHHRTYARPLGYDTQSRSCSWMREASGKGLAFILLSQCDKEAA